MPASRALTVTTTNERQNMMCAIRIVQKPSCPAKPAATNRASSEEPITISGEAIGRKISRFIDERPAKSWRTSANAARVPRSVATSVASRPISHAAAQRLRTCSGRRRGCSQLSRVNPSKR